MGDTKDRHYDVSAVSIEIGPQLHPKAFISRSMDLLQVSFGRPIPFPAEVQRMATFGKDVNGILIDMPNPDHYLVSHQDNNIIVSRNEVHFDKRLLFFRPHGFIPFIVMFYHDN